MSPTRAVPVTVPITFPDSHGGVSERLSGRPTGSPTAPAPSSVAFVAGSWIRYVRAATTGSPVIGCALSTASWARSTTRLAYASSSQRDFASSFFVGSAQPGRFGCERPSVPTTVIAWPPNCPSRSGFARCGQSPLTLVLLDPRTVPCEERLSIVANGLPVVGLRGLGTPGSLALARV